MSSSMSNKTDLILVVDVTRLSATPLAVSTAGRGASSEALALLFDEHQCARSSM